VGLTNEVICTSFDFAKKKIEKVNYFFVFKL